MRGLLILGFTALVAAAYLDSAEAGGTKAHPGRKVVCYFGSWAVYRPEGGKFDVESIDPYLCTHVIFGFTGLRNGTNTVLDPFNDLCEDWGKGALTRFSALKKVNERLKTMVAIGGWNEGSERYSKMAQTAESRKRFIDGVVKFLKKYDFDGFDLDWEYPSNRGGAPEDKANFALLVKEMRTEFDNYGYILSAAVSAGEATIRSAYDVPTISSYLDFINVMAYDYHGAWEKKTGHNAPLYRNPLDTGVFEGYNVNHSINFWISQGAPREKLILGMASYGRGVTLDKENDNGLYAPGSQALPAAPFTRDPGGYWGYNEICEKLKTENWTVIVDPYYKSPYAYQGRLWIGYDDIESIRLKSQFVYDNGLGGGMVWSLETDDFQGTCHGERFPLIKTIYRTVIGKYPKYNWQPSPPRSTSQEVCRPATTTPIVNEDVPGAETTTPGNQEPILPDPEGVCKAEGLNEDPKDCSKFYNCVKEGNTYKAYQLTCAAGTAFNPASNACSHPYEVPSCKNVPTVSFIRQNSL